MTIVDVRQEASPPPHDLDAERALLGTMLLGTGSPIDAAASVCTPESFYSPNHSAVFDTIVRLHRRGEPVEPVIVHSELWATGQSDILLTDLVAMQADAPSRNSAAKLAEVVADRARRRSAEALGAELSRAAKIGNLDIALAAHLEAIEVIRRGPAARATPTLRAFLDEELAEPEWVIPDLLERGDRAIVTGLEGRGKSTLLRQMAMLPAAGLHPFSLHPIPPVRVLLIDAENGRRLVQRKMTELRGLLPDDSPVDDFLYVEMLAGEIDLLDGRSAAHFEAIIDEVAPDLLVVGPSYKLAGGDPNEDGHAGAVQAPLDRLRARHDCAVILEAHTPHGAEERPFGASRWKRWPEFGVYLAPDGALRHWRGQRDERAWPSALARGGEWPWTPVDVSRDPTPWSGPTHCANAVLELLFEARGEELSVNRISERLKAKGASYRKTTVSVAAEQLVNSGHLAVRNGRQNSRLYCVKGDSDDLGI